LGARPGSRLIGKWTSVVVWLAVLLVPPFVARRNLHRGVGDRRGAWRIGFAVFVLQLASWALRTDALSSLFETETLLGVQLGLALVLGALAALVYLALEPYVRRLWPRSLIAWTRLLMGRLGDPRVGREVLIGTVAGLGMTVIQQLAWLVPVALGAPPRPPYLVEDATLVGGAKALAVALGPKFLSDTLIVLFVLTTPLLLLRRRALAVPLAMLILMLNDAPWIVRGASGVALLSSIAAVALLWTVLLSTLLRFGLLALASAFFVFGLIQRWPLTFDSSAWYAGTSLVGMLIVAVLASAAAFVARGGTKAWHHAVLRATAGAGA
jgi:hypothetical protein